MYCNTKNMLLNARKNGYAIGAFNISNMEFAQAVINAGIKTNTPVICQASESACEYAGFETLVNIVKTLAKNAPIEVALHLDHGKSVEICKKAVDAGFTSVMIDLSTLPYDENVKGTKEVVNYAHKHGVTVEAELGEIIGVEDNVSNDKSHFTDPCKAKQFIKETGVDSLAVSIGTAHGVNKGLNEPKIRFDILKELDVLMPNFPFVCHGASAVDQRFVDKFISYGGSLNKAQGIPKDVLRKMAINSPICKINQDTDLRLCFSATIKEFLNKHPEVFDPRKIIGATRNALSDYVEESINLFK
ncbi:MAG: ketose-bisphosphate aldolase [Christensenellales bacterium]